jgi:hypothetical protein
MIICQIIAAVYLAIALQLSGKAYILSGAPFWQAMAFGLSWPYLAWRELTR